jgi:hypothetical protein
VRGGAGEGVAAVVLQSLNCHDSSLFYSDCCQLGDYVDVVLVAEPQVGRHRARSRMTYVRVDEVVEAECMVFSQAVGMLVDSRFHD